MVPGSLHPTNAKESLLAASLSQHLGACETKAMDMRKISFLEHKLGLR